MKFRSNIQSVPHFIFNDSLLTNIYMEEIISENMSKFCTGDAIIMYQLLVWSQVCMALSAVPQFALSCRYSPSTG